MQNINALSFNTYFGQDLMALQLTETDILLITIQSAAMLK